jgi:GTPase SAR1 family protein
VRRVVSCRVVVRVFTHKPYQLHVQMQVWDMEEPERFSSSSMVYYRGAQGALLIYDVTSRRSFQDTAALFDHMRRFGLSLPLVPYGAYHC